MPNKTLTIKPMTPDELNIAIDWAAQEGWNPGLNDASCYYQADPNGFFMGYLGDEPIACISAVRYGEAFGFLGFYIVKPEFRAQGYGIQIWKAGLSYLKGVNVGLDGVVAQQGNYKKSGFTLAYSNRRYEGKGGAALPTHKNIVTLSTLPFEMVESYSRPFFPTERSEFLRCWLTQPKSVALGMFSEGKLVGYGVMRPCKSGYKIAPLFANTATIAESLFSALRSYAQPTEFIYLDVPDVNTDAVTLAENHGMNVSFETARMYTDTAPELALERTFGVTSFEIG